ncbi:MAG: hypothetical protein AB7O68_20255 [Pirellulales bacterium]
MTAEQERIERKERVERYHSLRYGDEKIKTWLGGGTDGEVWKSSQETAIKVFQRLAGYANERDTYLRLAEYGVVRKLAGFWIPIILDYDDELMIVEMSLMNKPPYVIDFAKVRIDRPPDFDEETLQEAERQGRERFEHNWPKVKGLLGALESFNIFYLDPNRGNITFPDMP